MFRDYYTAELLAAYQIEERLREAERARMVRALRRQRGSGRKSEADTPYRETWVGGLVARLVGGVW
jgi:hypothetical protein